MKESPDKLIAAILRHDSKQNTYKIALIRAINPLISAYAVATPIILLVQIGSNELNIDNNWDKLSQRTTLSTLSLNLI